MDRADYVILGMLGLDWRTGYEIKSLMNISTHFFWAA
jgi:DNA-binding PadR family transcriptional regulator